jgi:hypothetical protein
MRKVGVPQQKARQRDLLKTKPFELTRSAHDGTGSTDAARSREAPHVVRRRFREGCSACFGARMRFLVCASVLVLAPACTGHRPAVAARLQECGLASEGEISAALSAAFYEPNDCYRGCLAGASCEDLGAALCGTSIELLLRCDQLCAHRCADGSLIGVERVCDGAMQCEDGSDEASCPTFDCGDGNVLPARVRCDGAPNCSSGADERGCGFAECATEWGERVSVEPYRCDGYMHCLDGSDERACPEHRCEDGESVPTYRGEPRCDGWRQCRDGSDEDGCAALTPMCATP